MPDQYNGSCYCGAVQWRIIIDSPSQARTSLCHCRNCKKFFGSNYGLTTKVPWDAYALLPTSTANPTIHISNNSDSILTREFCGVCGSGIREWGEAAAGKFTYVCYGGLDDRGRKELAPKAEFFVGQKEDWCQDILGDDIFRKD